MVRVAPDHVAETKDYWSEHKKGRAGMADDGWEVVYQQLCDTEIVMSERVVGMRVLYGAAAKEEYSGRC